jgi:hypothetical protein
MMTGFGSVLVVLDVDVAAAVLMAGAKESEGRGRSAAGAAGRAGAAWFATPPRSCSALSLPRQPRLVNQSRISLLSDGLPGRCGTRSWSLAYGPQARGCPG